MIRIFLADDHPVVREGLRTLIERRPGMKVVGEASDGRQVLLAENKHEWDLLVLDLSLPRVNGIEVLRRLRAELPSLHIVILSMHPTDQYARRLIEEGAVGYLSKLLTPEELVEAIWQIGQGRHGYVWPALPLSSSNDPQAAHERLSGREYQVFTLIFQGSTVSEIAAELNLTVSTVSKHLGHVKEKLGARSIAEVVSYAHRVGLVSPL